MKQVSVWIVVLCLGVIGGLLIWVDNPIISVEAGTERMMYSAFLLAACLVVLFLDNLGVLATRKLGALEFFTWARKTVGTAASRSNRVRGLA